MSRADDFDCSIVEKKIVPSAWLGAIRLKESEQREWHVGRSE